MTVRSALHAHWRNPRYYPTGETSTLATWSNGVDTLLPLADKVAFHRTLGKDARTIVVPWAAVREIVPELMEISDLVPVRYRVRVFPDEAQWAKLLEFAERQ